MAMNLLCLDLLYTTTLIVTSLYLLIPASSADEWPLAGPPQELLFEQKTRLGSTPPNCHNRCNECNPCIAVEVPTLPSHFEPGPADAFPIDSHTPLVGRKYSNYKPLGWKCRCGNRLFNP